MREYGLLASRYVAAFQAKWMVAKAPQNETPLGSADIQSLADLSNSFDVVREMRLVPFGKQNILQLVILIALPLLPLTLTRIPLEEMIDRALRVLL